TANYRSGELLKVIADSLNQVLSIHPLTDIEAREAKLVFNDSIRSELPADIELDKIDTNLLNIPVRNADFKKWNAVACTNVIPNLTAAQSLFDFCAAQGCKAPNPTVNPCIPFQYVIDGCYARAHKMRWIIETMYKYCSYKVFSFANQNNDVLAVRAAKWGNCCVQWWYHVAPLVYVNVNNVAVAYVIDPGMFNTPVTLSTWLLAQQTTNCNARAHVSTYTVQPSSAYTPANYAGTQFNTDPNYVATNQTLIAYKNGVTCP
ncbi:MAG: protein-glutamine glutaminase family protein, partial [Chitinophagaceae bacterium]